MSRFSSIKYDKLSQDMSNDFKSRFEDIEEIVMTHLPASTERLWILSTLEMAFMFIGKAIRDDQIVREQRSAEFRPIRYRGPNNQIIRED